MISPFDGMADAFVDAFGRDVLIVDALGRVREVQGIFRRPSARSLEMTYRVPTLDLRSVDAGELREDAECRVRIGEEWFEPMTPEPDGKGMTRFELKLLEDS